MSNCRPVFGSNGIDQTSEFSLLYRQDKERITDDDLLKYLADFKKYNYNNANMIQTKDYNIIMYYQCVLIASNYNTCSFVCLFVCLFACLFVTCLSLFYYSLGRYKLPVIAGNLIVTIQQFNGRSGSMSL